jgi:hypothetical protein
MRFIQHGVGGNTGGKCSFMVGIGFDQILVDAIQGLLGNLCSPWIIEKNGRATECRELLADDFYVKRHVTSSI